MTCSAVFNLLVDGIDIYFILIIYVRLGKTALIDIKLTKKRCLIFSHVCR